MQRVLAALLCLLLASLLFVQLVSAEGAVHFPGVEDLMSVSEFDGCGLRKLTAEELGNLNEWLRSYTEQIVEHVADSLAQDVGAQRAEPSVIESRIDGDFEGWEGETIFKLQNGQIWQQTSYAYTYHYAYCPEVLIYKSGRGYKMKVDGVDREIGVVQLR